MCSSDLLLTAIAIPGLQGQNARAAARQVGVDQALVACALERHRLAHQGYPESLGELVPAYLAAIPTDVPAGGPLRYRRTEDGYLLYSLGSNGTDEGGRSAPVKAPEARPDPNSGDWVWRVGGK